jgi:hypothetical protein
MKRMVSYIKVKTSRIKNNGADSSHCSTGIHPSMLKGVNRKVQEGGVTKASSQYSYKYYSQTL